MILNLNVISLRAGESITCQGLGRACVEKKKKKDGGKSIDISLL